jgi:hypothetical protein
VTTTTSRARIAAVTLVLGVLAAGLTVATVPTGAALSSTVGPPTISLIRAPTWVAPGANFDLRVRLTGATANLILRVSVHPAITSRTAFSDTLVGKGNSEILDDTSIAVGFLPRRPAGQNDVPVGLQDPTAPRDRNRLAVEHSGVYPMTISLSPLNADPVASVDTWLVVAEQRLETPLSFAWVWQLVAPPLTSRNAAQVKARVDPGGRLARVAQALTAADGIPLSLVLGPETFETWARIAQHDTRAGGALSEVRAAVADQNRRQVLATPYVPLDLPSLASAGLADSVLPDLRLGADTVQSVLGVLPDPRTVLLDPVDAAAINLAREAFARRFVVRESAVRPVAHTLTPARPFGINSGGSVDPAGASSDFVEHLLDGPGTQAERSQRFLAGLSLIALEAPSTERGIVLATPANWNPDPALIDRVLAGLRGHPFVRATTLDHYFAVPADTNADGTPIVTTLEPIRPRPPTVTLAQLDAANQSLSSFRSLVGTHDTRVAEGAHAIVIAPSSALDAADATRELATIDNAAASFLRSISTTKRTITLTSRTAEVPLSFSNRTGQTVRVKVHLASTKLTFPKGAESILELPPRNITKRFEVQARTSGTFTLRVTLTTADDQFTINSTEMTVRSTVFSSIGVLLTVGALLFLAVWWGNHILRSRRKRRNRTAPGALAPEPVM